MQLWRCWLHELSKGKISARPSPSTLHVFKIKLIRDLTEHFTPNISNKTEKLTALSLLSLLVGWFFCRCLLLFPILEQQTTLEKSLRNNVVSRRKEVVF